MIDSLPGKFVSVPLGAIDFGDTLTDFSLSPVPTALEDSIRATGVAHPVVLWKNRDEHAIVCGHRRLRVARSLGQNSLSARVIESALDDPKRLLLNLSENRSHRSFSDVEKGLILMKLFQAGLTEDKIISEYMSWIGLERSKKLFEQFIRVRELTPRLHQLLHDLNVPMRVFSLLLAWSEADREAAYSVFSTLKPGANKWRDLLELTDEIAVKIGQPPDAVLSGAKVQTILGQDKTATHEKYTLITQALSAQRYPHWTELRKQVAQAMDGLKLETGTKIRVQDSFESDEMRIELKFFDQKSLLRQVEALQRAAKSGAMEKLIGIFKNLDR